MLSAAQEQAIRAKYMKHTINKTALSPRCRMCDCKNETISHIVRECKKCKKRSTREGTIM